MATEIDPLAGVSPQPGAPEAPGTPSISVVPPIPTPIPIDAPAAPGEAGMPKPAVPTGPLALSTQRPAAPAAPAAPAPGSFGDKLSKALAAFGATKQFLDGLGDVAESDKNRLPGQSALSGALGTLAAQRNRLAEQARYDQEQKRKDQERQDRLKQQDFQNQIEKDKAAAYIAQANASTFKEKQAAYIQGSDYMQKIVDRDKADAEQLKSSEIGVEPIQTNVDSNDLDRLLQTGRLNGHEYVAKATGIKQEGVDADGNPLNHFTYDIFQVPERVMLNKDQLSRIRTVEGYKDFAKGVDTLPMEGGLAENLLQRANSIATGNAIRQEALAKAQLVTQNQAKKLEANSFGGDNIWFKYINANGGNMVQAATHLLHDAGDPQKGAAIRKQYPNIYSDVMSMFSTDKDETGVKNFEAMRHQYEQEGIERMKAVSQGAQQIPGGISMTDEMKRNITSLPKDKQAVISKFSSPIQASLYSIAFGPGDMDFDKTFPSRVTAKSGQIDSATALGIIKQLNPGWQQQQYKATANAYKEITFGRNGQDVETYNNLLSHMANAQDVIEESLRKDNPKFLNSAINLAESQGWGTEAAKIQAALEPVKTEFENLMMNGHALDTAQKKQYDTIINPASTPAQLEATFKQIGATGAVRLTGLNDQYKKISGKNAPGILRQDGLEAAKHLNLDNSSMNRLSGLSVGQTLFNNPEWTPGTPAQQQQQTDTLQQQRQAAAEAAKMAAQQAFANGSAPKGSAGVAIGSDGGWYYVDAQYNPLGKVQ